MPGVNDRVAEAESRIGTVLRGKWRIERLLGLGGMAAVYEARHKNHSRVAVKILHRHHGLSVEQVARFQREGYAANRVGHHGVVEVYDDDVDEQGSAFLVMELLAGQSVAELAASRGKLPAKEVLAVADGVLDVLATAHARGILHRDIKPENLFLTTAGELKVLDFGIARLADAEFSVSATEAGTLLGTPAFLPPEQARGRVDSIDARTDLWAVGATIFTLLTGRFVHEATTPNEQLGLAMTASAPSLKDVMPEAPAALVGVVDRALAYSQADRWGDARTMQNAVQWTMQHWDEIATSGELVPEEWSAAALREAPGRDTLGADGPVSSAPMPSAKARPFAVTTTTAALVVMGALVAYGTAQSSAGRSDRQPSPVLGTGKSAERPPLPPPAKAETAPVLPPAAPSASVASPSTSPPSSDKRTLPPARVRVATARGPAGTAAPLPAPSAKPEPEAPDLYDRRH